MALNQSRLNSHAINSAAAGGVIASGEGTMLFIEQSIKTQADGTMLSFAQTITLQTVADGTMLSFEQTIKTEASGTMLSFEQLVYDAAVTTFYDRNDWYPKIAINSAIVPDSLLTGIWKYQHNEGNSALFEFSIRPAVGVVDLYAYQGNSITCDVLTDSGLHRIFTGIIDIPEINTIDEWINFKCTDNREEHLNSGQVTPASIGYSSQSVFGLPVDIKTDLTNRLSTVPYALDWDGYGVPRLTPWLAKSTADYTLSDSFVYREDPSIRIESRGQIINQVDINFTYSYQRYHEGECSFVWNGPQDTIAMLTYAPSMCSRDMVRQAQQASGWPLRAGSDIAYTDLLAPGLYNINGVYTVWTTTHTNTTTVAKTSINPVPGGDPINVVDDKGNQVYQTVPTSSTDLNDSYCSGASWNAVKRWSQNVQEQYTISVTAPQSISKYGLVTKASSNAYAEPDDGIAWDNNLNYSVSALNSPYYYDVNTNLSEYYRSVNVLINQRKTTILASHRDSRVSFKRFLWPQIDLRHTVALTATRIPCKGKVVGIYHEMDCTTGEGFTKVDLALYRSTGTQAETALTAPARPSSAITAFSTAVALGSHYGEDPTTAAAQSWTGHIGNRLVREQVAGGFNTHKTTYQESFIVDTPDVPAAYRNTKVVATSATYNINIPNDSLVWNVVGKS